MNQFDWFVIPFAIGFWGMMAVLVIKVIRWWMGFSADDRKIALGRLLSVHFLRALVEMVREGLLHRKIFKVNPRLGYMHMSLALGWFLLILIGKLQTMTFTGDHFNPVWYAIFFKYFEPGEHVFFFSEGYEFLMDASLLLVLSGVAFAWLKRVAPSALGMKKTTGHIWPDKLALTFLWFVFPVRLISESVTASIHGGGSFLTGSLGALLRPAADSMASLHIDSALWWSYSVVLGGFFLMLPWSRYMHIPAELMLIFFRHLGVSDKSLQSIELEACSRCGICIDGCAMLPADNAGQAVYYVRDVRYGHSSIEKDQNCLMCGSCETKCPVGIRLGSLRLTQREKSVALKPQFDSIKPDFEAISHSSSKTERVLYFPGCVGALTPAVTKSMEQLMQHAGIEYKTFGNQDGLCCGRPLMLAGQKEAALELMTRNSDYFNSEGGSVLVTSCPVCYKMFTQQYSLKIEVLHHSQWIERMVQQGKLKLKNSGVAMVYHDPCELGRGSGVYESPRNVLARLGHLDAASREREAGVCCGGSLGGYTMDDESRRKITRFAVDALLQPNTETLVTACPMCKKTFATVSPVKVKDISEVVYEGLIHKSAKPQVANKHVECANALM